MNKTETTENALVMLWKIASHTPRGCVALMKTLNEMKNDDTFDSELVADCHWWTFTKCQEFQLEEGQTNWAGDLK